MVPSKKTIHNLYNHKNPKRFYEAACINNLYHGGKKRKQICFQKLFYLFAYLIYLITKGHQKPNITVSLINAKKHFKHEQQ